MKSCSYAFCSKTWSYFFFYPCSSSCKFNIYINYINLTYNLQVTVRSHSAGPSAASASTSTVPMYASTSASVSDPNLAPAPVGFY